MKHILLLGFLLVAGSLWAQQPKDTRDWDTPKAYPPMVSQGEFLGDIPPLRDLEPRVAPEGQPAQKLWRKSNYFALNDLNNPNPLPQGGDPLVNLSNASDRNFDPELVPGLNFEGLRDPSVSPPDPSGDIGKDHYVQMINTSGGAWFQVWNKQGQSVYGPALTSTIWSQVNSGSIGDPIIQYDHAAQRWLMTELQAFGANQLLLAISNTSDPTGGWKAYSFSTLGFPDYPKLYVWPNAYFLTANELAGGNKCAGFALDRAALLAGAANFQVYRFEMPNYLAIQYQPATGADWEGGPPPPPGSPGYIFRVYDDAWDGGQDHLQVWEVNVDWQDVSQSSIVGPQLLYPAPFETRVCFSGLFDCIEQPDVNAPRITALENIIMYRAPYRNFGDHESVVFNHVADVSGQIGPGGDAAVRWYELRKTAGSPWSIHQQGTYAPDLATNRFMGTISMDDQGNIGLGYSVCSNQVFPGLRLTGRRAGDPVNQMPVQEYTVKDGEANHTGDNRWGDYSTMAVDPEDGRTFWFTGEYQANGTNWGTRIATFRVQLDTFDVTPIMLIAPTASNTLGAAEQVKVELFNSGLVSASGVTLSLYLDNVLITSNNIGPTLAPGNSLTHTFTQTVNLATVGKYYHFMVVADWDDDSFAKNDTLRATIRHLTSNDAASAGRANFPGLICGSDYTVNYILRNASATPLQNADIHWKINAFPYNTYQWTGNLAPGARDTVPLYINNINNGVNFFYAHTTLPNGLGDEDTSNDSLFFKFFGNLSGTYIEAKAATDFGVLKMELRTFNNSLLITREFPAQGEATYQICTDDNTCYKLVLASSTQSWQGHFRLLDIYGEVLVEAYNTDPDGQTFDFCTPARKQVDVGAIELRAPVTGSNLSAAEPVTIAVRNFGLSPQSNLAVSYRFEGGPLHTETLPGPIQPAETVEHTFSGTENLGTLGQDYQFELSATVNGDQDLDNDTKTATVLHRAPLDLAALSLEPELFCSDTANASLNLTIQNQGLQTITSATLTYTVNGVPQASQDLFISLVSGQTQELTFTPTNLVFGANTIVVDLTNVEGQGEDLVPANDQVSVTADISADGFGGFCSVFTDNKPEETRWQILDAQGLIVASGGPYDVISQFYFVGICLKKDKCYTLRLLDSGGDGMNGLVQFDSPSAGLLASFGGGNFGALLDIPFCTGAVGTQEPAAGQRKLSVTPNPTTGLVQLMLPAFNGEHTAQCHVFNQQGGLIQSVKMTRWDDTLYGALALDKFPSGVYYLKTSGLDRIYGARVVKQ